MRTSAGGGGGPARVGWITALRVRQEQIRIGFSFDEAVAPFTTEHIDAHLWEFDVSRYEALAEAGIAVVARDPGRTAPPYVAEAGNAPIANVPNEPVAEPLAINPSVFRVPGGGVQADLVAVMMPFDRSFDSVYGAIQAACHEASLESSRVDSIWEDTTTIQDIFSLICRANFVVVDFTGRNPDVFYETGIAHTLGKHVVPITQHDADVPFDLRHHRFLRYLSNAEGLQELTSKLASRLATLARR